MKSYIMITGAAGGLGKAFAVECASRGMNLFLTDIREQGLKTLTAGLHNAYGIEVLYHACDLTDVGERERLIKKAGRPGVAFHGLINVAGLDFEGSFMKNTSHQLRTILRINIESTVAMTHEMLALKDHANPFRVVNVSSLASFYPMPYKAVYAASKRFILDFSMALRQELKAAGDTVTTLCPAGLPTTDEIIASINSQGIFGILTTENIGTVAKKTMDHALKGRALVIPGGFNKFLYVLSRLLPASLLSKYIKRRWEKTYVRMKDAANPKRFKLDKRPAKA